MPGLIIAGLSGGSGKTIISLGITAAWKDLNIKIASFKKGPDYIDAGWLAKAAGRPCYNLDTFLCTAFEVEKSFQKNSLNSDIALIEGNRGLYDGIDTEGKTSTAEIAKLLNLPVLLVLDCTKSTRTMAALVLGCMHFDPELNIMGVVLNRIAGKRHEGKVRDNIKKFCGIPVFGAVPRLTEKNFPERHMGLVPYVENSLAADSIKSAAKIAKENINLDALYRACIKAFHDSTGQKIISHTSIEHFSMDKPASAGRTDPACLTNTAQKTDPDNEAGSACESFKLTSLSSAPRCIEKKIKKSVIIGIIRDSAFQFYYPDNLEALEEQGAELKFISPLKETCIPPVDAIYMGGGFPETHARELAANEAFRGNLKRLAENGLPVYAECGGLIFLGESMHLGGEIFPMSGILPVNFSLSKRPVGHGYTKVKVIHENPFYEIGETIKGHEFRYSSIIDIKYQKKNMAFEMKRGKGIIDKMDGFCKYNVLGTYTHIMAKATPSWAVAMINRAIQYKQRQN